MLDSKHKTWDLFFFYALNSAPEAARGGTRKATLLTNKSLNL